MIANRKMKPIGIECIVFASKHESTIGGVFFRAEKVSIVANVSGEVHSDVRHVEEAFGGERWVVYEWGMVCREEMGDNEASFKPGGLSERHESVEGGVMVGEAVGGGGEVGGRGKEACICCGS